MSTIVEIYSKFFIDESIIFSMSTATTIYWSFSWNLLLKNILIFRNNLQSIIITEYLLIFKALTNLFCGVIWLVSMGRYQYYIILISGKFVY